MRDEAEKLICHRFRRQLERLSEQFVSSSSSSCCYVRKVKIDRLRCCVSNHHYSSISPAEQDYFSLGFFSSKPEKRLLHTLASADNKLQQVISSGMGKKDIYKGLVK